MSVVFDLKVKSDGGWRKKSGPHRKKVKEVIKELMNGISSVANQPFIFTSAPTPLCVGRIVHKPAHPSSIIVLYHPIMQATATASRKDDKRRMAAMDSAVDLSSPDCELMAIKQFTCKYVPNISIDCTPLHRLFMVYAILIIAS